MCNETASLPRRQTAFAGERKDRCFFEPLEDTLESVGLIYLVPRRDVGLRDAGWKLVATEAGG
jgi:hypothetical protein